MIKNENIILFSSDDWNSGLKTSKYHVAIGLAKNNKVLFVNSVGLRSPTISSNDFMRIWQKLKSFFRGYTKINENLYVYTPIIIPFQKYSFVRILNHIFFLTCIRVCQLFLKIKKPIILVFAQNVTHLIGKLGEKQVIYYCIDELASYRGVDKEKLINLEKKLLQKSDAVITCSQELQEKKKLYESKTYYVPHGVDWQLFQKTISQTLTIPDDIAKLKKPIIGYYGFISEDWIDFELLKLIAKTYPDYSVVLIGRSKIDLSKIFTEPNIHFLGVRPFESLPSYNSAFDVSIIPFCINDLTKSSNPLKLFEYLSSGLPVVTVDIPEVHKYQKLIYIAENREDFVKKIKIALEENSLELQEKRSNEMKKEDWDNRLEIISQIITKHGRKG